MADPELRERMLAATVTCVSRSGLNGLTVEQVADEAGVGRATVYRYFDGGRDQLVSEAIMRELFAFFARLGEEVEDASSFPQLLGRALVFAHRSLLTHELMAKVLATERERLLVKLAETAPFALAVVQAWFVGHLATEDLVEGVDVDSAAWYLARLATSVTTSPGSWDLDDPEQVRELVDTVFLAGILAD